MHLLFTVREHFRLTQAQVQTMIMEESTEVILMLLIIAVCGSAYSCMKLLPLEEIVLHPTPDKKALPANKGTPS